jgi:glucose-6-phosphate 1-dehydrogenase
MSAIIQASPFEKLSQEPLPTGDSCLLVIFGASGDLTNRKLIPGLYKLACEGCMNPQFEVFGIGRTPMSPEEFRKKTGEAAAKSKDTRDFSESGWEDFETAAALHGRRHQRSEVLSAVARSARGDGEEWFEPKPFVLCVDARVGSGTNH